MSKYIRTEDGVYEVVDNLYENGTWYYRKGNEAIPFKDNQIIPKSDTIEELCDEFVLADETLPPHLKKDLKELCRYKIYIAGSRGSIYGAIWTDKGLIYVAKMNDKGELELL